MQKKENRSSHLKIEDLEAKKLSVEELAAVTGGTDDGSRKTVCEFRHDDCGN